MKNVLAVLIVLVAGLGVWGGYTVWERQPKSAEFYAEKVNSALKDVQPQQAFDYVNEGIAVWPERLDLRFGKIYMCQMIEDYRCMHDEIIRVIVDSGSSVQQWRWTNGEPKDTAFMLGVLQNYQNVFWNAEKYDEMNDVAEKILEYFPDHVESLNVVAINYLVKSDWANAEPYLVNAQKLAPDDEIVKKNMQKLLEMKAAQPRQ